MFIISSARTSGKEIAGGRYGVLARVVYPASGPKFPLPGLLDSLESIDGEIRISIRMLNVGAPEPRIWSAEAESQDLS